jgi:GNAT superfamily N-acetyltransferase
MTALEIRPVDPHDAASFGAFYRVYIAAAIAIGPGIASPWMPEEYRAVFQEQATSRWTAGFAGRLDEEVVVVGRIQTPLLDNLESAEIDVQVDPQHQRQGLGTLMLGVLEEQARDRGRTLLNAEAAWAYDAGPDGTGTAGPGFARSQGFALGLGDVKRRLSVPVDDGLLDALAAEAAPHHAAYELRSWAGPVPDDLAEGWVRLESSMLTEAPTGEPEVEPAAAEVAVLRENEAIAAAQGRTKYNTVALDADGDVIAYTDIATTVHEPERAYQWGTLVRRDARGHRLGLAVKVANQRLLQRECPDLRELLTYNAEVNAHMIEVNERLGFVPVARLGEFQKRL